MRNGFTSTELAKIRKRPQGAEWYVAIHRPKINEIFLINNPSTLSGSIVSELSVISSYGTSTTLADMTGIVFDSNTVNLGEVRIRKDWTGGVLSVAESGSGLINWTKAYSIAVIDQYRPWIKHPRMDTATSQWRMDFDIPYDGQLNNWGPYVNMGPPIVSLPTSYVESSGEGSLVPRWVIDFYGNNSVSIQNIIDGGSWTFPDGQTVTSAIGTSISPIRMTFDGASPGGSYVTLAVSDNTGASHLGRRLIFLAEDISQFPRVAVSDITGGIESGGYQARLTATNLPESTYPYLDNSEIIVFERANYGSSQTSFGGNFGLRENIIFRGWVTTKDIRVSPFSSDMFITAETVGGVLADADSYDMFIANYQAGGSDWTEMQGLCLDGVAQFALKWRSTLGKITDWSPMGGLGTTEVILYQDLPRGGFFDQLKENYSSKGVLGYFSADMQSNLFAFQDININGSSATAPRVDILPGDLRDDIEISTVPRDVNSQVSLYAVTDETPLAAESPANVRGYFGGERIFEKGLLVDSQDRLITWTGNYRAKLNSKFPRTTLRMANNMRIDPVPQSVIRMSLAASDNSRGITWTDKDHLTKELNVTYDSMVGYPMYDLVVEEVVNGIGGSSIPLPDITDIVPIPTEPPPPGTIDLPEVPPVTDTFGTGFGTVYALINNSLYRTRNFSASSPVWVNIAPGSVTGLNDFILDPWSPATTGFLLGDDGVYRSEDLDTSSPSWTQLISAAQLVLLSGTNSQQYYKIVASINVRGFLSFIATTTPSGMIHYYSTDNGDTWGYHSITRPAGITGAVSQSGAHDIVPHLVNGEIVLYASYTEVSGGTGSNKCFLVRSLNGGVSWSQYGTSGTYTGAIEGSALVHCPYSNNEDGSIVYWGQTAANGVSYLFKTDSSGTTNISRAYVFPNGGGIKRWMAETYTMDNSSAYQWEPFSSGKLYTSDDGGASWTAVTTTGIDTSGRTYSTGGFPVNSSQFYLIRSASASIKVYVSTDRGSAWTDKTGNISESVASGARSVIVPLWTE